MSSELATDSSAAPRIDSVGRAIIDDGRGLDCPPTGTALCGSTFAISGLDTLDFSIPPYELEYTIPFMTTVVTSKFEVVAVDLNADPLVFRQAPYGAPPCGYWASIGCVTCRSTLTVDGIAKVIDTKVGIDVHLLPIAGTSTCYISVRSSLPVHAVCNQIDLDTFKFIFHPNRVYIQWFGAVTTWDSAATLSVSNTGTYGGSADDGLDYVWRNLSAGETYGTHNVCFYFSEPPYRAIPDVLAPTSITGTLTFTPSTDTAYVGNGCAEIWTQACFFKTINQDLITYTEGWVDCGRWSGGPHPPPVDPGPVPLPPYPPGPPGPTGPNKCYQHWYYSWTNNPAGTSTLTLADTGCNSDSIAPQTWTSVVACHTGDDGYKSATWHIFIPATSGCCDLAGDTSCDGCTFPAPDPSGLGCP